ncbi:MAG: FAD-dependent oxidoreductase [Ruminococcaceae bacterium]|nr:FAD-dependent oxidoreductase [Oscillospiraceae bacterium]
MESITLSKKLSIKKSYDVIVCGGGVAGVAAAVTAAKNGSSVLIIEKSNILGGLATLGLVNLFVPMCNGNGKQIIFGLCEKWARLSAKYGYDTIPEEWKDGEPKKPTSVRYIQRYSPYIFALQLTEEITSSGADILFDCIACDPVMEGNVCKGVITESKSGTEFYACKMLIDVTGDCDVLRRGKVPTVAGENFYSYFGKMITLASCKTALEKEDIKFAFTTVSGGSINLYGDDQPANIPKWSGLTVEEVSDYLVRNQHEMLEKIKKTDRKSREIAMLPLMPNFRTTCRIAGDYSLSVNDAYRHFDDSICAINDFDHRNHLFEVPLRTLCRHDYPNMITAGRSASGVGYGWDLLRVIPPAILTGQAAAHAACQAIREQVGVSDVNIKTLQKHLENDDVMIHFPDEYVPEDKSVIIHGKNAVEIDGGHN